jgi:DNA invertase Pin-like site-specific DNA recombinase
MGTSDYSIGEQNLDLQRDALTKAGCDKIFTDEMSGTKSHRPGLMQALAFVRKGDTLVVWRLDRLGRSLRDLLARVEDLRLRAIDFKSLQESIDTTTPAGKLQFHIFSALAEFERDLIHERTMAGLRAARARGRKGGRKPQMTSDKLKAAALLMKDKTNTVKAICHTLGVSRATLYRYVTPTGEVRPLSATAEADT